MNFKQRLLNQKLKQIELKEFCELRQSKSECQIALKDLLSAPVIFFIYCLIYIKCKFDCNSLFCVCVCAVLCLFSIIIQIF